MRVRIIMHGFTLAIKNSQILMLRRVIKKEEKLVIILRFPRCFPEEKPLYLRKVVSFLICLFYG